VSGADLKSHLSIYIVTGLVLVAAWVFIALIPHYRQFTLVEIQIKDARQKLSDFQETIKLLPEFVKMRNELAKRKNELNSNLYTKENILSLFEKFYLMADKYRVNIVEITPPIEELLQINRIVPDSVGLMFLNITIRVEGDYRDFGRFIGGLEGEPFYRGPNSCSVVGTNDRRYNTQYIIGFKSLLGSLRDGV
jgi:hypothetical protein